MHDSYTRKLWIGYLQHIAEINAKSFVEFQKITQKISVIIYFIQIKKNHKADNYLVQLDNQNKMVPLCSYHLEFARFQRER